MTHFHLFRSPGNVSCNIFKISWRILFIHLIHYKTIWCGRVGVRISFSLSLNWAPLAFHLMPGSRILHLWQSYGCHSLGLFPSYKSCVYPQKGWMAVVGYELSLFECRMGMLLVSLNKLLRSKWKPGMPQKYLGWSPSMLCLEQ